ncbi:glycoside hydrolase family 26 protein [Actinacidiphila rubida]|uniref:Glycosyl hydrolase family 26 n=1 Tax=Actinacidiphila rubida TaxID=310780 RepID=A0A1H8QVY5_9ACTN|nr:glycosyl hydrolase [Actinacidiphila rubida]SEO58325.1 Glycosyl hydrolase family 26 [Actinacidiphila rubida]
MTSRIRSLAAAAAVGLLLTATAGCSTFSSSGRYKYQHAEGGQPSVSGTPTDGAKASAKPVLPYDIRPLLKPEKKYFGVSLPGFPASMQPLQTYASLVGKKPDMVETYAAWGDQFESQQVQDTWDYGAMSFIAWEPMKKSLADIAAGKDDAYIHQFAQSVAALNLPVAISFAHEMNGFWYPWGTKKATPQQFVSAWKHVHDVFAEEGATQVIWVWSPNVIGPMKSVRLKPFWPGDAYVDWIGVIGYYGLDGPHTYKTLYGPTMDEVRGFTKKPFIIAETASEGRTRKPADIDDLFQGTAKRSDVVGFIWFDYNKETDWRVDSSSAAAAEFRRQAAGKAYGVDVRKP